ncbi:thiol-disulfide oxidoreductase DCC family protein [Peribacillus cavernae]|uniref:Thiol-disulfide oxidoreductase DCC family protein n=1 Tax=Peribacillus cavernae TaxID=1674310 RepID=A0A433HG58_9BACI|nr:thiol-disulfide oxidoreductase DCC family protein [Peribacillus cavernae]MDQ0219821.1 putative DCC family thiol-disulfide oxidoreductase YuxK [Peribacillus cavernae]RUQ27212.1 thiol-disulfide oxidoreductase DCC family protein [Peribacillus cavernae]
MDSIVLFDGICNLCNSSVQFILKRDPVAHFKFGSLQSDLGQETIERYRLSKKLNSIVLIENDKSYTKSTAVLRICKNLKGAWKLVSILRIIPRPIRDFFYDIIAKNRYKWFGKQDSCMLPSPEFKERFID